MIELIYRGCKYQTCSNCQVSCDRQPRVVREYRISQHHDSNYLAVIETPKKTTNPQILDLFVYRGVAYTKYRR